MWRVPESDDDDDEADFYNSGDSRYTTHGSFLFKVAFLPTQNDFIITKRSRHIFFSRAIEISLGKRTDINSTMVFNNPCIWSHFRRSFFSIFAAHKYELTG